MVAASLRDVRKSYGSVKALDGLDLDVADGEVLGLIGPSGAGKTSAAKALVGLLRPDSGQATVFGLAMPSRKALSRVGYMAQSDALFEDLDAWGNLSYFAALQGMGKKEIASRGAEIFGYMDLASDSRRPVRGFSGGMRKRLSLAIALVHAPELLVLDEPTVGMDPRLRLRMWERFRALAADGAAVLVTTHVMDEADRCDRLALVFEGRVIAQGAPDELRRSHNVSSLEELFLSARPSEGAGDTAPAALAREGGRP
jgi:ABC-2 type transport system ATP-binding protein